MQESQRKDSAIADLLSSALFDTSNIEKQIKKEQEIREQFISEIRKAYEQGEDISEYVWPREWDFRKRPKPHHASNIVSLADAVDLSGQHFYGAGWNEKEWYARSPEAIDQWNPEHDFYRAWSFAEKKKGADFTNNPEEEKQAFDRKQRVYSKLSSWLSQEAIEAFTLDDEGNKSSLSNNIWLSRDALTILDEGQLHEKNEDGSTKIAGKTYFVYLNKEQLEAALASEDQQTTPDTPVLGDQQYIPPYIGFMLQAVAALDLSSEKRASLDDIMNWLNENWPEGLEGKSKNLIKYMATLIRRPQDKRGGNTPWK